jgi:hypothetical protein
MAISNWQLAKDQQNQFTAMVAKGNWQLQAGILDRKEIVQFLARSQ